MAEDSPNYEPLEAADDLCLALSFGRSPTDIAKRGLVRPHSHDGDAVQSSIGCRFPLRFSRCLLVLPLEAGTGQAPHSFARAASERMRSGLSPTKISISAAVPTPMPWASTNAGERRWTSF
nr:hypothetical protein [Belnapia moabensis]